MLLHYQYPGTGGTLRLAQHKSADTLRVRLDPEEQAVTHFGQIDVLVNNADYGYYELFEGLALDQLQRQIDTNVYGVVRTTQAVLPFRRQRKSGHIINIFSIAGTIGMAGRAAYSARMITRCFSCAVLLLLSCSGRSHAQWYLYAGPNVDWVRAPALVGTLKPQFGYHLEGQYTFVDWTAHEVWVPMIRMGLLRQGYRQEVDERLHRVNFSSFVLSPGVTYHPNRFVTASASVDVQALLRARYRVVGDTSSVGVAHVYRGVGLALRSELVLWSEASVSPYVSASHALRAALKYPRIDAVGNFTGTVRDLWHRTVSVGIRIAL